MSLENTPDSALHITTLLRRLEWVPRAKAQGRYEVWSPYDSDSEEVIVPLNPENGDYLHLLERARRYLLHRYGSEAERIEALIMISAAADLDSTQWRKETVVEAGLIPWAQGEAIFTAARDSLVAAARAVRSKKPIQGKSGGFLARRFMEQVFMGQTEVGSFVVTAHMPASTRFHVNQRSENLAKHDPRKADTVSGRMVVDVFENAIMAVRETLTEFKHSPRVEMFAELVPEGVSLELVRSLATLTRDGDAAVSIQRGDVATPRKEVAFDSTEAPVLDRVVASFEQAPEPRKVSITGEVSLLDNSTSAPIHLIRVDIMKGADVRRVRVRLTPEQYDLAVSAHAGRQWITMSGSLEKDGRDWWLYHAHDVTPTPPDEGPVSIQQTIWDEETIAKYLPPTES